jgi:predicted membrane protein
VNDPYASAEDTLAAEPEPPRRSVGQIVFGSVLVAAGLAWLVAATDLFDLPWRAVFAGALVAVGAAVVASARRERHSGLIVVGAILTVLLTLVSTAEGLLDLPFAGGIGERSYTPQTVTALSSEYRLGIGELVLDLRAVDLPPGETALEASVTIGSLVVILPADVAVRVTGHVTAGEVTMFGTVFSGTGIEETITDSGYAETDVRLRLEASTGLGEVEVRR